MIARVLVRLATVWAVIVLGWALILSANVPGIMGHGGWETVVAVALAPLAIVAVLKWVLGRPQ